MLHPVRTRALRGQTSSLLTTWRRCRRCCGRSGFILVSARTQNRRADHENTNEHYVFHIQELNVIVSAKGNSELALVA